MSYYGGGWPRYQSVSELREKAQSQLEKLKKKQKNIMPVMTEGRLVARTFWGKQWCRTLEICSDYDHRLPRGRSYVRHGAVVDLQVTAGNIRALVAGSRLYKVSIRIEPLEANHWRSILRDCTGQVASLVALLQGRLPPVLLEVVSDVERGLFPEPNHMIVDCSSPDWASLCKHAAAALYGVGARLDSQPELLFLLRQVDPQELIQLPLFETTPLLDQHYPLAAADLSSLFGIEWDESALPKSPFALASPRSPGSLEHTPPPEGAPRSKKVPCRKTAATCHAE